MKPGEFSKGFKDVRKHIGENKGTIRAVRSCNSCEHLKEDELCHNPNVTSFDMTVEEESGKKYCSYWRLNGVKEEDF